MMFSEDILIRFVIFLLGFGGFLVAWHIYKEKKAQRTLICPARFDCDEVVHSNYSKFLGISLEILGMTYYIFIALSYLVFIFITNTLPNVLIGIVATISMVAFLFSIYLIFVQLFILKKGCSWCFVSAFICILIFFLTIQAYDFSYLANIF
jgi:uncharacterized membrane protein